MTSILGGAEPRTFRGTYLHSLYIQLKISSSRPAHVSFKLNSMLRCLLVAVLIFLNADVGSFCNG